MYAMKRLQATSGTWYWAVHFRRRGRMVYQRFYDPKHGGSANAKKAAIAWRDAQLASIEVLSKLEFCQQLRSNNTSGEPGVHFLTNARQPEGMWQAKLKLDGKARHKSFSVLKYGYQAAYEMAVAARRDLLAQAKDKPYLSDKLAIKRAPPAVR